MVDVEGGTSFADEVPVPAGASQAQENHPIWAILTLYIYQPHPGIS
jgi:hypothetical protein